MSLVPAYIATGAVVRYALDVASVGHIRASELDVAQAFSLIPLERHLRAGAATLLSTPVLGALVGVAVVFGGGQFPGRFIPLAPVALGCRPPAWPT